MAKATSCGVIVTDGPHILLGHATRSPRWDIPKGIAGPGERFAVAAARELNEETGLMVPADALRDLGVHPYLPGKDLALFAWRPEEMPGIDRLACRSRVPLPGGATLPEFDRFGVFDWNEALRMVGKNLARVLREVRPDVALAAAT